MGYSLVNILGGLLIVTSTMVVVSKTIPSAIKWYAIQSVVLVGVLLTLGLTTGATELLMWAASAFVTKVILVPFILNRAYKKMGSPADSTLTSSIKPAWTIILTGLEVAICFAVVTRLSLPTAEVATPALAISFAHFFVGLTCIISQRNILKQIFGYCLMENGSHVTVALLACPLVFSLIMAALPKTTSYSVFAGLNTISVAATLVLSVVTAGTMLSSGQNIDALGLWLHLDSLSSIFVLLVGVIGFITGVYSISYIKIDIEEKTMPAERTKQYYALFSLFVFTMLLACLSNNIILTWAAVEATTLSTVFLVGIYKNKQALEASWKYAMVCTAGVAFGLFGTLLIYANAADIMPNAHEAAFLTSIMPYADQFDPMLVRLAFAFIVIGFGTKAGLFPMHTWLPDAHSQAPSPVSALLSGVLLKCAMLVIIRFYSLSIITVGDIYPRTLLLILGTLSILVAALCIFKQDDIKRRFAYSSVDNVGVVALCLGIGGPLGIAACLLHCIFHGFTKALAFCMAGNIQHIYHTRDLNKIKGVVEIAPVTAALTIIALLALAAFPPFALFISEFLTFVAGVQSGPIWVVVLVAIGLTGVYFALTGIALKSIFGKAPEGMKRHEVPALMIIPEIALAIVVMWSGIATPVAITSGVEDATSVVLNQSVEELHEAPLYRMVFSSQTKTSEVN